MMGTVTWADMRLMRKIRIRQGELTKTESVWKQDRILLRVEHGRGIVNLLE